MIIEELKDAETYKELYKSVFNSDCDAVPPTVIVGRKRDGGNIVAFIAGFWNNSNSFYIQNGGVLPEFQRSGVLRYFSCVLDDAVTYDMAVRNTNVVMLKTALSIGFIPIGCLLQGDGLFIQLKRQKNG